MGKYSAAKDLDLKVRTKWYVLANRLNASIYKDSPEKKFEFIKRMENPQARLMEKDFDADKPGRNYSSSVHGSVRHALDRRSHSHEKVAKQFAVSIAKELKKALREERYRALILVAEPHFLGLLRNALPKSVQDTIEHSIHHEYTHSSDKKLRAFVLKAIKKAS